MMKRSILNKTNGAGDDATATNITTTSSSSSSRTAAAAAGGVRASEANTGSSGDSQRTASNGTTSTSPFSGNQTLTHEQTQTSSAAADETKKQKKPLQFLVRSLWNSTVRDGRGGMTTTVRAFLAFLLLLVLLWTSSLASIGTGAGNILSQRHLIKAAPPIDIGRKAGTPVILNIGSNLDPIVPRPKDDPCTVALAFEPIVGHQISPHPSLHVIHAAVSYDGGWSAMNLYNKDGRSSSLNEANHLAAWSNQQRWNKDSKIKIVPTISFRTILESLEQYDIQLILTDMQGHDFKTVSSVGDLLVKVGVRRLVTEVYKDNVSTYKDSHNDLCLNWLPYMTSIGYVFEGLTRMAGDKETLLDGYRNVQEVRETCAKFRKNPPVEKVGVSEYNAYWRLKSEPVGVGGGGGTEKNNQNLETHYFYGTHSPGQPGHVFSKEAYEKCRR